MGNNIAVGQVTVNLARCWDPSTSNINPVAVIACHLYYRGPPKGINPELDTVVKALTELGDGGKGRGKEGWLNVLTALMQVSRVSVSFVLDYIESVLLYLLLIVTKKGTSTFFGFRIEFFGLF